MKNKLTYILALLVFLSINCFAADKSENIKNAYLSVFYADIFQDSPTSKSLSDKLDLIKENFKRINSTANWTSIDAKSLWESPEGGEIKYYYQNDQLEKIVTIHYGETFRQVTEFYLLNGQLSFTYSKLYRYNRPFYYDEDAMKMNNDTEAYDPSKTIINENRSYIENGEQIYFISDQDESSRFSGEFQLREFERIKESFEKYFAGKDSEEL